MTDTTRAETLIADIERLAGARCACAAPLCGHELLFSFLLGYKSEPRCVACLAKELGRDVASLSAHLVDWVRHRDCHRAAWDWTSAREGDCPLASLVPSSPPDQVVAGFQSLRELIHDRPGSTGVVLHIPAGSGREQEMTLRVGVAYDAELVGEATRRIGALAELHLA